MKTSSAKAKGRRLQQWARDQILETFTQLEEDDVKSTSMGVSGPDVQLSPRATEVFNFAVECKNQERLNLWEAWNQAEGNCGKREPVLIVKRNGSAPLAVIDAEYFFEHADKLRSK